MISPEVEISLLRKLEEAAREMMAYTGWEDDCDEEAANTVCVVKAFLDVLQTTRALYMMPKVKIE